MVMTLYDRYVDWASSKLAASSIFQHNVCGMYVVSERKMKINEKVADTTGVDFIKMQLDSQKKAEEYRKLHPGKAFLIGIGKATLFQGLVGVEQNYYLQNKS